MTKNRKYVFVIGENIDEKYKVKNFIKIRSLIILDSKI